MLKVKKIHSIKRFVTGFFIIDAIPIFGF